MYPASITSQGQVSIPAKLLKKHNMQKPGKIVFYDTEDGVLIKPAKDFLELAGTFHSDVTKGMTSTQILKAEKKAVEEAFVEHYLAKEKRSGNKLLKIKTW